MYLIYVFIYVKSGDLTQPAWERGLHWGIHILTGSLVILMYPQQKGNLNTNPLSRALTDFFFKNQRKWSFKPQSL